MSVSFCLTLERPYAEQPTKCVSDQQRLGSNWSLPFSGYMTLAKKLSLKGDNHIKLWTQSKCSRNSVMPEHISSCLWLGLVLNRDVLEQWSPTPGPWTVRKQAVQQKVRSRQATKAPSAAPHLWRCNLNHLSPSTLHLWKNCLPRNWSLVPKRLGTTVLEWSLILQLSLTMGGIPEPPEISVKPYRCSRGI